MRTRAHTLLVAAALLGAAAAPARGQETVVDPRWTAFLGCWEPTAASAPLVCVVPAAGVSAVDLVTIVHGEVAARERIAATGERRETTSGDCAGWQSAEWSARGQRVFLRSEDACGGGNTRTGTGVIAMTGTGEWLYIQGVTVGGATGLRVLKYREATSDTPLPIDVADALRVGVASVSRARAAAGARLSIEDVVDAARRLDAAVLEAWLAERAEPFTIDGKGLIALADAGVPTRVIDLMVALSYPKYFAINAALRQGERRVAPPDSSGYGSAPATGYASSDPLCYTSYLMDPYASYYCHEFGYRPYSPYGFDGYGYGYYPGGYPITIVFSGSGGSSRPHGRVVNGNGYAQGGNPDPAQATPRPTEPRWPSSSGSGSTGSASGSSGGSSGSGEQRTAKPRPPK